MRKPASKLSSAPSPIPPRSLPGLLLTSSILLLCPLLPAQSDPPRPEPVRSSVTIVGNIETETPASITVVAKPELARIPGVNIDDRLRLVPGFSLFRRSSSLVANPTTQGVSLRGIGSTGASRSLVLWDGIPINDPFGGWVYWTRFSPDQIDRVEIVRGASTSVFGDRAMGGAISLFAPSAEKLRLWTAYEGGNFAQNLLSGGVALPFRNRYAVSTNLRAFQTDGFYIVPRRFRGRVDTDAGVRFIAPDVRFDIFGDTHRFFLKGDLLAEDRDNGTVLQRNSTSLGTVAAHYSGGRVNNISLLGYHTRQEYRQSFSTIVADRTSERLTSRQTVPSEAVGGALLFRRQTGRANFLAGADVVRVNGFSNEQLIPTGFRTGGGSQLQHGVFGQVNAPLGPAVFFAGLRHHFTGQDSRFLSPSAGITATKGIFRFRASGYRSFRAPTLNELFREFRAGTAVTQPNANLRPEALTGIEAGVDIVGETTRLGFTAFRNSMDDLITNVTLSSTPQQIIRQRRNAAAARSSGFEAELRKRFRGIVAEASYLYAESRFRTRERLPQVPKHQGSAQFSYARKGTIVAAGMRSFGLQFEDDLNRLIMPGYAVFHFTLRQSLWRGVSATANVENAFNREYVVGISPPIQNTGAPRLWRLGLRWER